MKGKGIGKGKAEDSSLPSTPTVSGDEDPGPSKLDKPPKLTPPQPRNSVHPDIESSPDASQSMKPAASEQSTPENVPPSPTKPIAGASAPVTDTASAPNPPAKVPPISSLQNNKDADFSNLDTDETPSGSTSRPEEAAGEHVVQNVFKFCKVPAAVLVVAILVVYSYSAYSSLHGELILLKRNFSGTVTDSPEFQEALEKAMQAQFEQKTETLQQEHRSFSLQIDTKMQNVVDDVSELQDDVNQLRNTHSSDNLLQKIKGQLNTVQTSLTALEKNITDNKGNIGTLQEKVGNLELKVTGLERDVAELKKERKELKAEVDQLKFGVGLLDTKTKTLESDTVVMKTSTDSLKQGFVALQNTVVTIEKTYSNVKDKLANVTSELGTTKQLLDYLYAWSSPAAAFAVFLSIAVVIICVALRRRKLKEENLRFAPRGPAGPAALIGGHGQRTHGMNYPDPPPNLRLERQLCLVCFSTPALGTFPRLVRQRLLSRLVDLRDVPVTQVRLSCNADIGNIPPSALTIVARSPETRNTILEKAGAVRGDFHLSIVNYLRCIGSQTFLLVYEDHESRTMARDRLYHSKFDVIRDNPPLEEFIGSDRLISMGTDFNEAQANRLVEWLQQHWARV